MKNSSIAKISRPVITGICQRERLFNLLDQANKRPITWVAAPAGSGKTTLVASWLDARAGLKSAPTIWYQVDAGDGDLATFFYYMGLAAKKAAPGYKNPLPLLTPEYLQGIPTFTRRYFENLYGRIISPNPSLLKRGKSFPPLGKGEKGGFTIVLDNYQDVPLNSGFHEMIVNAMDVIPEGVNVIVISRGEPPAQLSRLKANNKIDFIGWDKIRFTIEETQDMLDQKGCNLTDEALMVIQWKTGGWAAGLVLMIESTSRGGFQTRPYLNTQRDVFDYFANEIFAKISMDTRQFLLKTSFLPTMTSRMAEKLTGVAQSHQILSNLSSDHFLTDWRPLPEPVFQSHPLFREFLLAKAKEEFSESELSDTRRLAASLLADSGNEEDAAGLFRDAKDWDGLTKLVLSQAQTLVTQGRNSTLQEWISVIPKEIVVDSPWLLYWLGISRLAYNPAEARGYFEKAYALFKKEQELSGVFLAWSAIVDTFVYEWGDFHPLDRWISEMESALRDNQEFPSMEIEGRVVSAMFCALMYRQPHHPDLPLWEDRIRRIIFSSNDIYLKLAIGSHLIFYYTWWNGEQSKAMMLVNSLRSEVSLAEINPLSKIAWRAIEAACSWMTGDNAACLASVQDGQRIAGETGVHLWDFMLLAQESFGTLTAGDLDAARVCHQRMAFISGTGRRLDIAHYHYHLGWEAMCCREFPLALEHMEIGLKTAEQTGEPFITAFIRMGMAEVLIELGNYKTAKEHLDVAFRIGLEMKSNTVKYQYLWIEAMRCFASGDDPAGTRSLAEHLAVSREYGILNHAAWRSSVMTPLYVRALDAGIEVEHVQRIIRTRGLTPESSHPALEKGSTGLIGMERWPWPLRVYTLGRFEIVKDGKPVEFSGKVQKKPSEMLKAIIAFCGRNVGEEQLIDTLWPEAEGDAAHSTFKSTLHRLRQLIGNDNALTIKEGRLTLDPRYCWIDAWAFQRVLAEVEGIEGDKIRQLVEKGVSIYNGDFLSGDKGLSWAVSMRERLKGRYILLVGMAGQSYIHSGEWEKAIKLYQKALEINDLEEEFYRGLMLSYGKIGRRADVQTTYRRCGKLLASVLSVEPSPETKAVYKKAMSV